MRALVRKFLKTPKRSPQLQRSITTTGGRIFTMLGLRFKVGLLCLMLCLCAAYAHDEHEHEHKSEHGHKEHMGHDAPAKADEAPNYFTYPEHRGLLYGHILMICIGWVFVMPVGEFLIPQESHLRALLTLTFR